MAKRTIRVRMTRPKPASTPEPPAVEPEVIIEHVGPRVEARWTQDVDPARARQLMELLIKAGMDHVGT